jgi:hypothetical protein
MLEQRNKQKEKEIVGLKLDSFVYRALIPSFVNKVNNSILTSVIFTSRQRWELFSLLVRLMIIFRALTVANSIVICSRMARARGSRFVFDFDICFLVLPIPIVLVRTTPEDMKNFALGIFRKFKFFEIRGK